YSVPFIQYLSRCQMLLQQGRSVADVLYYYGDHIPNLGRYKEDDPAGALPDYDYDLINEDKLLVLAVKNGRIVLPHGVSYRVLVLPNHQVLSLAALKKIQALVNAGATVIGTPALSTASLVGGANAEKERAQLVQALWGSAPGAVGTRTVGKGRMIWGKTAREVLLASLVPDCAFVQKPEGKIYDYIHRQVGSADIYFLSSQNPVATQITAAFRMQGKQPELWDAVTGEIRDATTFYQKEGKTFVPLDFGPNGSIFVVFRKALSAGTKASASKAPNYLNYRTVETLKSPWRVLFDPEYGHQELRLDSLISWTDRPEEGIKYFSGTAVYRTTFDATDLTGKLFLDLGTVKDVGIARVKLNGKDLGILWCPPFRVPITDLLKPSGNELEIAVVNSWRNRLVGDRGKPQNERITKTNVTIKPEWPLLESGLLGPVRVMRGE
ncbi:MAG TPA: glycosyl hydrolase, partial [Haliscomenobacter sp.]|uniref:glycosyl hydrolase n=1 Tax=Haliscomenobacter sp. TaxID=2717303 RepID=UPI002C8B2727